MLAVLHYNDVHSAHRVRATQYTPWLNEHNWTGINFPFNIQQLSLFERQNSTLGITIIHWSKDYGFSTLRPAPLCSERRRIVHILLVDDHFVGVINLEKLLNTKQNRSDGRHIHCPRCLQVFDMRTPERLEQHQATCSRNEFVVEKMPEQKEFCFTQWNKTMSPSHVMYFDLESLLLPDGSHLPIMAAFHLLPDARVQHLRKPQYHHFQGVDCVEKMLEKMGSLAISIYKFNQWHFRQTIEMSPDDDIFFEEADVCYLCKRNFEDSELVKVRDHDHLSGSFIGASCSPCNMMRREQRAIIPVIAHNFRGYDSHFLIKYGSKTMKEKKWELNIIPSTREQYLNIRARVKVPGTARKEGLKDASVQLNFIDSLQFLSSSLASLAANCPDLRYTNNLPVSDEIKKGKGVLPYSFFNDPSKLNVTQLPAIEDFFDTLTQTQCSQDDYDRAQLAWREFNCKSMGDYMEAYLKLDVLLLTDVFESFRRLSLKESGLEPVNFVGLPGLTWSAAYKFTGASLHLLQDKEQYKFFESGIRGGMTFVNDHRVKANESTELLYVDAVSMIVVII